MEMAGTGDVAEYGVAWQCKTRQTRQTKQSGTKRQRRVEECERMGERSVDVRILGSRTPSKLRYRL
jgi:hypothetical protein